MAFTSRPMSRNDRGAKSDYRRKFTISVHALERFRERVDEEFKHRNDFDLGNLLDEKLRNPESQMTVRDPRAPEEITYLYEIHMRRTGPYYVVVRGETAVTVLDADMAQRNFAESWKTTLNTPFNNDKLKQLMHEVQLTPKPKLTPIDEAVLRGDVPPKIENVERADEIMLPTQGAAPEFTPLELAGLDYARTLQRYYEADRVVERAKKALAAAEAARNEANIEREAAQLKLNTLVSGDA